MRQCHFCSRWFGNRQGVRRHLGFCTKYREAGGRAGKSIRERLFQCEDCVATFGTELVKKTTREEMHAQHSKHGGCEVCRKNNWLDAGWKLVPVIKPGGGAGG